MITKKLILPIILFLLALSLRLWNLNIFPVGITHDELDYIVNAKSVWLTGEGIDGVWSPWTLTAMSVDHREILSELPALIFAPLIGLLPSSLFAARVGYAVFSAGLVVMLFLTAKLFFDKKIAGVIGVVMAFNPWGIMFGRTAFEPPVAVFFYITAIYLFFKLKHWQMLWAVLFLFLGFFCYHGSKLLYVPLVVAMVGFKYFRYETKKTRMLLPYLTFSFLSFMIFVGFVISLPYQDAGRRKVDVIFSDTAAAATAVNDERRLSIPTVLNQAYSNKVIYLGKQFVKKYLGGFASGYLFVHGDNNQVGAHTLGDHGLFYYVDILMFGLGLVLMYVGHRKHWLLFTALLLLAPIPAALSVKGSSYVFRASLLYPVMVIFIGYGLARIIFATYPYRKIVLSVVAGVYFFSFMNLFYLYFYRYPVYGSEGFYFSKRVLSEYLKRIEMDQEVWIVYDEPIALYLQYLFYTGKLDSKSSVQLIKERFSKHDYSYGNVHFTQTCPDAGLIADRKQVIVTYYLNQPCMEKQLTAVTSHLSVSSLLDTGQIYQIYNDSLCSGYDLKRYPRVADKSEYDLGKLSDQQLCELWIANLD